MPKSMHGGYMAPGGKMPTKKPVGPRRPMGGKR